MRRYRAGAPRQRRKLQAITPANGPGRTAGKGSRRHLEARGPDRRCVAGNPGGPPDRAPAAGTGRGQWEGRSRAVLIVHLSASVTGHRRFTIRSY